MFSVASSTLIRRVRVRAADADSARSVVPSVIGAPCPDDIALANATNDMWGAVVTAVDFTANRKIYLVRLRGHLPPP